MAEMNEARFAPSWASAGLKDHARQIDMGRLRAYRLARLQAELRRHDYAAALLLDPINIRYATGSRNMSLWTAHTPARYCFVPAADSCGEGDPMGLPQLRALVRRAGDDRPDTPGARFLLLRRWQPCRGDGEGVGQRDR
jgi:hypothetical protein